MVAPLLGTSAATFDHGDPGDTIGGGDSMNALARERLGVAERRREASGGSRIVGVEEREKRLRSRGPSLRSRFGDISKRMPAGSPGGAPSAPPGDTGIFACDPSGLAAGGVMLRSNGKGKQADGGSVLTTKRSATMHKW